MDLIIHLILLKIAKSFKMFEILKSTSFVFTSFFLLRKSLEKKSNGEKIQQKRFVKIY